VRAEKVWVKAYACNPLGDESGVLSRRDTLSRPASAGEHKFAGLPDGGSQVIVDRLTSLFRQLEPDGLPGLLLSDRGPIDCVSAGGNVLDLEGDEIATTQLAIGRQIEHCQIARPPLDL